ncbi:arylsulfatase B-like [Mizuhopecten yessoensis]|uniref:Arylsulfatase B n=1 Tax=Mizuhopecten yessoensis TaxID=6573 RepID=A0A210PLH3_MIZYE|nr:arylsulfatase B-like [Mizuhopecten yessoensis]OWF37333.1 Arylsulfatase B [Mizuhopecten yessoensis]
MKEILGICVILLALVLCIHAASRPHIVFVVSDDLGWNDVGWHNQHIGSYYLSKFAHEGVILDNSYMQPVCSPSRGSVLSGYYPFHTGLQHGIIMDSQPKFLPSNFTLLPEKLQELGYATHMVGKWHLGFCNWKYTPNHRGFDSFMGYYSGAEDYYTHQAGRAYDFRLNDEIHHPPTGEYSTETYTKRVMDIIHHHDPQHQPLFLYVAYQSVHSPLQVPQHYSDLHPHIPNENRRTFTGMVNAMDESFGNITNALKTGGYWDNLLIIFTSDNGGSVTDGGNNWPLRGNKGTLWEGGTRVPGFVYSPSLLSKTGYTISEMIHAVDWFPTMLKAAGGITDPHMDGVSQWEMLQNGTSSARTEFVYNIDDIKGNAAIRVGDYKLITGDAGRKDDWYTPNHAHLHHHSTTTSTSPQLFNLRNDPTEHHDISSQHPNIVSNLQDKLANYRKTQMSAQNPDQVQHALQDYNGVWTPGWC